MTRSDTHHAFPVGRVLLALAATALAVALVGLAVTAGLRSNEASRLAIVFSCGIAYLASVLSLVPIWMYGPRGVQPTVNAFLAGMLGRPALCLLAGLGLVYLGHLPGDATLLGLAGAYVPLLIVEVRYVARYLAEKGKPAGGSPGRGREALI